jgi:hypothetical protein
LCISKIAGLLFHELEAVLEIRALHFVNLMPQQLPGFFDIAAARDHLDQRSVRMQKTDQLQNHRSI